MEFSGSFFPLGSASKRKVFLSFNDKSIYLNAEDEFFSIAFKEVNLEMIMSGHPIVIYHNGRFEFEYNEEILKKFKEVGILKRNFAFGLESSFKKVIVIFLIAILTIVFFYSYFFNPISEYVAFRIPNFALEKIDTNVLSQMDKTLVAPSQLSQQRQKEIKLKFDKITKGKYKLFFRRGMRMGQNAFALAYDHIVITDELIDLLRKDEYILSVLLHEAAHIDNRDVAISLVKDSFFILGSILILGDVTGASSSLTSSIIAVGASRFIRDQELRADKKAVEFLEKNNLSPKCFVESLKLLQASTGDKYKMFDFLSTHPRMNERINFIEKEKFNSPPCT